MPTTKIGVGCSQVFLINRGTSFILGEFSLICEKRETVFLMSNFDKNFFSWFPSAINLKALLRSPRS